MHYQFLRQKALTTSIMVGIICGVIGCFIISGMALMGDAILHAVLPGVALSICLEINSSGAVFTGCDLTWNWFYQVRTAGLSHASIGIMFTAAFASGIIMITLMKAARICITFYSETCLLFSSFGNVVNIAYQVIV